MLQPGESIISYLRRRIRDVPHAQWPELALRAGVAPSLLRKIAYGDRLNPGVAKIQPLLDYFTTR
jgi:transcriptional regulator with XRE-family HTH domain